MHRLKREIWKAGIALAGLLIFLILMLWIPISANAYEAEGTSGFAMPGTVQPTPTVDLTVTALAKEQLTLQVKQLQNQLQDQNNWLANNSTAVIAAVATVIVALFGILQWAITVRQAQDKDQKDREDERQKERDAQDKDLRAQAEERFKTAVTALGDEKESTQVGGAILLRSFLNEDDKKIYGRYYTQIFDLAVAYLRPSNTSLLSEKSGGISSSPESHPAPLALTPLRQALIVVFREVFPLARDQDSRSHYSLDATGIQLDHAYLVGSDLKGVSMPYSSLRMADLTFAKLEAAQLRGSQFERADFVAAQLKGANLTVGQLSGANFNDANLEEAYLRGSWFEGAYFRKAHLNGAWLEGAVLRGAHFNGADLSGAILTKARLNEANFEGATLQDTDLRGVYGLTKEQLATCKAKGAIIDEVTPSSSPAPSHSPNVQALSAPSVQEIQPLTSTDGSGHTSSEPSS